MANSDFTYELIPTFCSPGHRTMEGHVTPEVIHMGAFKKVVVIKVIVATSTMFGSVLERAHAALVLVVDHLLICMSH